MTNVKLESDFDAFGYNSLCRSSLSAAEAYGLDYESAREATPRWYGVSFGDGNDGVSHMWPDYYVCTDDPWTLARAALIGNWNAGEGRDYAIENMEVDGEAEYTIQATILDPPDDGESYQELAEAHGYEVTEGFGRDAGWHWWQGDDCDDSAYTTEAEAWQACCEDNNLESEQESWCNVNGAWIICEVFPIEDIDEAPRYASPGECFDDELLAIARRVS